MTHIAPVSPVNQWSIIRKDLEDRNETTLNQADTFVRSKIQVESLYNSIKQEVKNAKVLGVLSTYDYYCLVQLEATLNYLNDLAKNYCLNHNYVYFLMGNLSALHRKMLSKNPDASLGLAGRLATLSDDLANITTKLNPSDGRSVDWHTWAENMVSASCRIGARWPGKFADGKYVPRLSNFTNMVILGCDAPTVVFRAVYAPAKAECVIKVHKYRSQTHEIRLKTTNALTAVAIDCPFLIRYLACFSVSCGYVALHEYYKAYDFEDIVELVGAFDLDSTIKIAAQLILAVEHLHLVGLIHRDLKQKNVLMSQNGRVKVIDYDINRPCMGHHYNKSFKLYFRRTPWELDAMEETGWFEYKPPELYAHRKYGRAYDWWAVGCNVYKTYFGRLPFRGNTPKDYVMAVVQQTTLWPSETLYGPPDPHMKDFLFGLLQKDPEQRLGSNSYADLKTHMLFENLDFATFWKKPDIIRNSAIDECIGQIENKLAARDVVEEPSYFGKKLDDDASEAMQFLETVEDHSMHEPMYTYVAESLKKIQLAISKNEFYSPDSFLETDPELIEIDYSKEVNPDNALKLQDSQQKTTTLMGDTIKITLEKLEAKEDFGIGADLWHDGSKIFWIVTDIVSDGSAARSNIFIGDIIVEVNAKQIKKNTLASLKKAKHVELTVMALNFFRLIRTRRDTLNFLRRSRRIKIILAANELPNSGLTVVEREAWDMERQMFVFVHLILRIDSSIVTSVPIYSGDVLAKINNYELRGLPISAVNGHLSAEDGKSFRIEIFPLSVLRKPIKRETAV